MLRSKMTPKAAPASAGGDPQGAQGSPHARHALALFKRRLARFSAAADRGNIDRKAIAAGLREIIEAHGFGQGGFAP